MADMITRCPKCDTAFRITPAHLRSAKGSVRCGSCLHVFNAKDHLAPAQIAKEPAPPTKPQSRPSRQTSAQAPAPSPAQPKRQPEPRLQTPDPDDVLISDDMDLDIDTTDPNGFSADDLFAETRTPRESGSLFERAAKDTSADSDKDQEPEDDDESWALKLLDEDDQPEPALKRSSPVQAHMPSPSRETLDLPESPDGDAVHIEAEETAPDEDLTDWAASSDDMVSSAHDDESAELFEPPPLSASRRDTAGNAYLDAIEPEPVEFSVRAERPFWRSRVLWGILSLVALIALLAQIAWLQYPSLNRIEPYRTLYAHACQWLGCQLPAQADLEAIRTSNLVVRSHPRTPNALMVDVILQNTAPFPQPFPALELTFSDLQSRVVAQRRFAPAEYLGGELAGASTMPVRQPVHIAIEIVDPGQEAVNYRVDVVGQ